VYLPCVADAAQSTFPPKLCGVSDLQRSRFAGAISVRSISQARSRGDLPAAGSGPPTAASDHGAGRSPECSSHGHPNWIASNVIMAAAPTTSRERAREMVDAMLAWTIARHPTCFWNGLQGERIINRY